MSLRVGVIGCGYWGPKLIRNFSVTDGTELAAVSDLKPERLAPIKKTYPGVRTTTQADEILDDPSIHAVAVCTPVSTHYALAKKALERGKHVLVEKPLTDSAASAKELVALADKQQRVLMVDHTFIYTSAVKKIKSIIDAGELGEIYYFDSVRVNLGLFQSDINVIWDLAPHDFSIMDHVLNRKLLSVSAIGVCHVPMQHKSLENIAYVTVRLANNTLAHFHVNWLSPVKVRKILIGGSKKMLVFDDLDPENKIKIYDRGINIAGAEERYRAMPEYRMGDMYAPHIEASEALAKLVEHFRDSIAHRAKPLTGGAEGLTVVRLLEAASESIRNNGKPVEL